MVKARRAFLEEDDQDVLDITPSAVTSPRREAKRPRILGKLLAPIALSGLVVAGSFAIASRGNTDQTADPSYQNTDLGVSRGGERAPHEDWRGSVPTWRPEHWCYPLARTILASPRLILLDEPLSGLDGSLKYQIIPYLQQVFSRFSIPFLFISHSPEEMRLMTEQVIIVAGGRVAEIVAVENLGWALCTPSEFSGCAAACSNHLRALA